MITININSCILLTSIFHLIDSELVDKFTGFNRETCFNQEYSDESKVQILTYKVNQFLEPPIDLNETLATILYNHPDHDLLKDLIETIVDNDHVICIQDHHSLCIHCNDQTLTLILHYDGQW